MEMLKADTQALLRLVRHNEEAEKFNLSNWFRNEYVEKPDGSIHYCGTHGCLVGNDMLACRNGTSLKEFTEKTGNKLFRILAAVDDDDIYRCPATLFQFLFSTTDTKSLAYARLMKKDPEKWSDLDRMFVEHFQRIPDCECVACRNLTHRYCSDKDAAIARVRKAIYYILRKRELLYDEKGEFSQEKYEAARRIGDAKISEKVLAEV